MVHRQPCLSPTLKLMLRPVLWNSTNRLLFVYIYSESTNDSRNVLEASSDSTDSSSCDELPGWSSDKCADLISNRLYRLRKRKCLSIQSHPKRKQAKISDFPQRRVAGKRTRKLKALSKSRKKHGREDGNVHV